MNEKILNIIYKKICEGFKTNFIARKQFENEYSKLSENLLTTIVNLTKKHHQLKHSKIEEEFRQVVKFTKEEFIIEQFNADYARGYSYSSNLKKFSLENLSELQNTMKFDFERHSSAYDIFFETDDSRVIEIPLLNFFDNEIPNKTVEEISEKNDEKKALDELFWEFFRTEYLYKDRYDYYNPKRASEILNSPQKIIEKFSSNYLNNTFIKLLDKAEKHLADESISNFDTIIVNVGERYYQSERSGWTTNYFRVFNNQQEYIFSHSSKDEKLVKGEFIHIFIHQKKHLIKISVTLSEVERIPYIIYRDCEKVTLKNECEIVIGKHHGNETIVFDTRKEALVFQAKLIEIREGMGRQK